MSETIKNDQVTYLILAGGRGQRMQGVDKGLMLWKDKAMIQHIIEKLQIPPNQLMISANRNFTIYQQYTHQVIKDQLTDYQGPLAGILSALTCSTTDYLLCVPCDSPSPPRHLLSTLQTALLEENKTAAICHDGERTQPLFCLLSKKVQPQLDAFLHAGHRKVQDFFNQLDPSICDFSKHTKQFHNFNQPADMSES